mgnify:CR=1 FL=1
MLITMGEDGMRNIRPQHLPQVGAHRLAVDRVAVDRVAVDRAVADRVVVAHKLNNSSRSLTNE